MYNGAVVSSQLSQRELAVLALIGTGKTSKEIAAELQLSIETIGSYRKSLCKKLNLHSTAELAVYGTRERIASENATNPADKPPPDKGVL
jgi:DNA-binding CsgD family transcriptional regulator